MTEDSTNTKYTHAQHVPHTEQEESSKWQSMVVLSYAYPAHQSVSEVNCSDADTQVISCHCYLVIFRLFVDQLTVIYLCTHSLACRRLLSTLQL